MRVIVVILLVGGCSLETAIAPPCAPDGKCPAGKHCIEGRCLEGSADMGPAGDLSADLADQTDSATAAPDRGEDQLNTDTADARPDAADGTSHTYSWQHGDWGDCPSACWGGEWTRDVWCEQDDGSKVDAALCDANTEPDSEESCSATEVCYWWRASTVCQYMVGKCVTHPTDKYFLEWDCCSTTGGCGLPSNDCIDAIGGHGGTCHADSSCGSLLGTDFKYPE